jgi:hypothetical protein
VTLIFDKATDRWNYLYRLVSFFDSNRAQEGFEPPKEPDPVQQWVQPTIGNAIVHFKRLGMMDLMMSRFQYQARTLQPANSRCRLFLVGPFVKNVGCHGRRSH